MAEGGEKQIAEAYRNSFAEFRSRNLFNPWSLDGLNESQFKSIKFLDQALEKYPWYQGLSVFGSTMFGYGLEDSDVDFIILYSRPRNDTSATWTEIAQAVSASRREAQERFGIDIHEVSRVAAEPLSDAPEHIRVNDVNTLAMFALSFWTTQRGTEEQPGPTLRWIQEYRKLCTTLEPETRKAVRQNLLDMLHHYDLQRESKIEERIGAYHTLPDSKKDEMKAKRRKLWEERIQSLFGL